MTVALLIAGVAVWKLSDFAPKRLRPWLVVPSLTGLGLLFIIEGWVRNGHVAPLVPGAVALAVAALIFVGALTDHSKDAAGDDAPDKVLQIEARIARGRLSWNWPKGELQLAGDRLRFRLANGETLFDVRLRDAQDFRFPLLRRGQLQFHWAGQKYEVAFGHSSTVDFAALRDVRDLWRDEIRKRPRTGRGD
jgi:hypothetical protein